MTHRVHQISHLFSGFIGEPRGQLKADPKAAEFEIAALTLSSLGG